MVASIILLVLGAIASTVFIVSKVTNYSLKTIIYKTIASLFFLALAILCFCLTGIGHLYFKLFATLGLFFGLLGDVFLGFKYITKNRTQKIWILAGMFAFALGHISYVIALLLEFSNPNTPIWSILPFIIPIIIVSIYLFIARKAGIEFGKKLLPFAIFYMYCLATTLSSAVCMAICNTFSTTTVVMFFIGAICFACSDFMLSGAYFKKGKRSKAYNAIYSIFYYVAQFLIAFSIFFLI